MAVTSLNSTSEEDSPGNVEYMGKEETPLMAIHGRKTNERNYFAAARPE